MPRTRKLSDDRLAVIAKNNSLKTARRKAKRRSIKAKNKRKDEHLAGIERAKRVEAQRIEAEKAEAEKATV